MCNGCQGGKSNDEVDNVKLAIKVFFVALQWRGKSKGVVDHRVGAVAPSTAGPRKEVFVAILCWAGDCAIRLRAGVV